MNYISLSDFMNDAEKLISDIILNEGFTTVKTKEGNVVIVSEQQFDCLIESLVRSKNK